VNSATDFSKRPISFFIAVIGIALLASAAAASEHPIVRAQKSSPAPRSHNLKVLRSRTLRLKPGMLERITAMAPMTALSITACEAPPLMQSSDDSEEVGLALELSAIDAMRVGVLDGPNAMRRITKLYGDETRGWLVGFVPKDSAAYRNGLRADDLIVEVGAAGLREVSVSDDSSACGIFAIRVLRPEQ
jgi:hypothetical protein